MKVKPISHWNYRVFHRSAPDPFGGTIDEWTIREAYYEHEGDPTPHSWTAEACWPGGETKLELMEDVTAMAACISSVVVELTPDGSALADVQPKRGRGSLRG